MKYLYLLIFILLSSPVVANDKTSLFSIASRIERDKYSLSLAKQVKSLTKQHVIKLETPVLGIKEYKKIRSYNTEQGQQVWLGEGEKNSSVSLIKSAFGLSGSIRTAEGTWFIRPNKDGQSSLEKFDESQSQQVTDLLPVQDIKSQKTTKQKVAPSSYHTNYFQHIQTKEPEGFSGSNDIRVLVYYSEQGYSSYPNLEDLIELDFANANQALINSNIDASYTIASFIKIDESINNVGLGDLLNRIGNFTRMDEMRDIYNADLVHFYGYNITDISYACGVAHYSVNSTGWINSKYGVGGTRPYCAGALTLAHELGHNLGAHHDRYMEGGGNDDYVYGYVDLENEFRTIMSYGNNCSDNKKNCIEIPNYSNPEVSYNEQPTGIDKMQIDAADNSQLITNVANVVANYNGVGYPSDFQVSKGTLNDQVTLTWSALTGSDGYEIKRTLLNGTCPVFKDVYTIINETTTTNYTIDEASSEQYCYWVRAYKDHAYGGRNFSAATPVEVGYSAQHAVHISDLLPQHVTKQDNNITIDFSTNVSTEVSVEIVDSNAVDWLNLAVESVENNQYQLIINNDKEISASALLVIKAGDTQEYLPVQFSGYSNKPPVIDIIETVEIDQGGSISIPLNITDDTNSTKVISEFHSVNTSLINNNDLTYADDILTINLSNQTIGQSGIIITAFDGELFTKKLLSVKIKRVIYRVPTIPEEVTLYVNAGDTLTRLLPGYSIDNDEIEYQLEQLPSQGSLSITGDSFSYSANSDFKEDSFILHGQLVTNGDENISDKIHSILVHLKPLPVLQLPYQQQIMGGPFTLLLTHRGKLWHWGHIRDENSPVDSNAISTPTPMEGEWVDMGRFSVGGHDAYLLLNTDGTLWWMGQTHSLKEGDWGHIWQPQQLGESQDWIDITQTETGFDNQPLILKKLDGSLWAIGHIGPTFVEDSDEIVRIPQQINGLYNWVSANVNGSSYALLNEKGNVWSGGEQRSKLLGRVGTVGDMAPVDIPEKVYQLVGDPWSAYAYTESGVYGWGKSLFLSSGSEETLLPEYIVEKYWENSSYYSGHFSGVTFSGELITAAKRNSMAALGRGENAQAKMEIVGTEADWLKSYSVKNAVFALKENGSLWVSGESSYGLTLGLGEEEGTKTFQFTQLENLPTDILGTEDSDNDGVLNFRDDDDDNDCVIDSLDDNPDVVDENGCLDTDTDGLINVLDLDDDNDDVLDTDDVFPLDANESLDTDGDGQGNNADTDDDNDDVLDTDDVFPLDPSRSTETDSGSGSGGSMALLLVFIFCLTLYRQRLKIN